MKVGATATVLALLMLAVSLIPVPTAASGSLTLNLSRGTVGTQVSIPNPAAYGTGIYQLYWGETDQLIAQGEITKDSGTISFTVPESAKGKQRVTLKVANDYFTTEFTVMSSISLSSDKATVGSNLTVTGWGFNGNESVIQIIYDGSPLETAITANSKGSWQITFKVPPSSRGQHVFDAEGITPADDVEDLLFTVVPKIEASPTSGWVGTVMGIAGSGFASGETNIKVIYDGVTVKTGIFADGKGSWQSSFSIPTSTKGSHMINAFGAVTPDGDIIKANFNVSPFIKLEPTSGYLGGDIYVGDSLWVSGVGFEANEANIKVTFDGNLAASNIVADAKGSWSDKLDVPSCTNGEHTIDANGEITKASDTVDAIVIISPKIELSPTSGAIDSDITVQGTGFSAKQAITISYDGAKVATGTATDSKGEFTAGFKIPKSKAGDHTVTVTDAKASVFSVSLSVESTPPPTPRPISPEAGAELGSIIGSTTISFDWSDVEDPSGVYYMLEISPSANFSGTVIRKEGLTASAYTLAKDEALGKGKYYWRVKAEDGAENQSEWTNGQLFKVGGLDWWLVLLIAVAVIIVIIVIWRFASVRRRDEWK
ncbi:MAG: IPT/TIG domain-containing protein [Chloroflexi bacterium]|nr:IPT/TIG domain-containing protein [Chloroflexota bacterium]